MRLLPLYLLATPALANPTDVVSDPSLGLSVQMSAVQEYDHNVRLGLVPKAGQLVVSLSEQATFVHAIQISTGAQCVVDHRWGRSSWFTLSCRSDLRSTIQSLSNNVDVRWVAASFPVELSAAPNDLTAAQWHHQNSGQSIGGRAGVVGADMGSVDAWDVTTGDPSVLVAVIDTGVWIEHEDLADRIYSNPGEVCGNGVDDDGNGYVDDCAGWDVGDDDNDPDPRDLPTKSANGSPCIPGHGTFIAGLVAAEGDNGAGISGVLQNARVLPIKMAADDECVVLDTSVAEGVLYSLDQGARVINASWSFGGSSTAMSQAFAKIPRADVVLSVAAGNSGRDVDVLTTFPIGYKLRTDIVVAASTNVDTRAGFSNWGSDDVDLAAPGLQLTSLSLKGTDQYEVGSGTSYAAPLVGGVAALILSKYPELRATEVRRSILDGAERLDALDCARTAKCVQTGARLYAPGALDEAQRWATSPQIKLDRIVFNDSEWDGDQRVERGETVAIELRVHNDGHAPTDDLFVTLFVDNEHLQIEAATVKVGRVDKYQKVDAPPVPVRVSLQCAQDQLTAYRVRFEDKTTGDVWEDERSFIVYCDVDDDDDGHRYPEDCDDEDDAVYPGAIELCNEIDDDCDEVVDEDDAQDAATWFPDADADGFGAQGASKVACVQPEGFGQGDQDCDDTRADVYPDADELCDERDNDCDGTIDEDPVEAPTWYLDADGDGWGDPESGLMACEAPPGTVTEGRDCDDEDVLAFPGSRTRRADCTQRPSFLGCACSSGGSGSGWWAAFGVLLMARRRRRRS